MKVVPVAKNVRDHCSKQIYQERNSYFDFQMPESYVFSSFYNINFIKKSIYIYPSLKNAVLTYIVQVFYNE